MDEQDDFAQQDTAANARMNEIGELLWEHLRIHSEQEHDGADCRKERINAIAYLAHGILLFEGDLSARLIDQLDLLQCIASYQSTHQDHLREQAEHLRQQAEQN